MYEDLVLSDVLLGDCNVLGIDSESDAIQRMTDTVFNNSDDESLLPELKPEFLDFVTQGTNKVNGGSRNSLGWGWVAGSPTPKMGGANLSFYHFSKYFFLCCCDLSD